MSNTRLHLGSDNYLYFENNQHVKFNGYPVKRWDSSNTRWSISTGSEIKEFKGKTILDLEKILWYVTLNPELEAYSLLFFVYLYKIW